MLGVELGDDVDFAFAELGDVGEDEICWGFFSILCMSEWLDWIETDWTGQEEATEGNLSIRRR